MQNQKLIALAQTLFYAFFTVATPIFISALGQGGALYGYLPAGVTGIVLFGLNYLENQISNKGGGALFGMIAD